jgi:hypothetical protein
MNATVQMTIKLEVKGVTLELSLEEAMELRHMLERVVPPVQISDPLLVPMPYPVPTYPTGPTWRPSWIVSGATISSGTLNVWTVEN